MRLSRRKALLGLAENSVAVLAVAASPLAVQTSTAQEPPADADLQSAREQYRNNARQIAQVKLPMATEPASHFKA